MKNTRHWCWLREVLLEYHRYLDGFNDPTIYNASESMIDDFLAVIEQNKNNIMNAQPYTNRYGDVFTFTPDTDGNLLWEGNFEYCRCGFEESADNLNMVDPSGGPYIDIGTDVGRFHKDMVGKSVTGFVPIDTGYKLTIQ
jgi:hypothetical protein